MIRSGHDFDQTMARRWRDGQTMAENWLFRIGLISSDLQASIPHPPMLRISQHQHSTCHSTSNFGKILKHRFGKKENTIIIIICLMLRLDLTFTSNIYKFQCVCMWGASKYYLTKSQNPGWQVLLERERHLTGLTSHQPLRLNRASARDI